MVQKKKMMMLVNLKRMKRMDLKRRKESMRRNQRGMEGRRMVQDRMGRRTFRCCRLKWAEEECSRVEIEKESSRLVEVFLVCRGFVSGNHMG